MKGTALFIRCAVLGMVLALMGAVASPVVSEGSGGGVFVDSGQRLGASESMGVALGDVDGDGDLDAFVANQYTEANKVWLNDGTGSFADSGQRLGGSFSYAVDLGDMDGDGDLDAFVVNYWHQPDKVWLNDGAGTFSDSGQSLGDSPMSNQVVLEDIDGDGDLDAFVTCHGYPNKVWRNDGSGTFSHGQNLGSSHSHDVALGDVDADGDVDAFVANNHDYQGEANRVWLNDGMGSLSDSGQSLGSAPSTGVALGDLDGDGDLDAFVTNSHAAGSTTTPGPNKVWLNDGGAQGGAPGAYRDSSQRLGESPSRRVALGDFDTDGDLDAFVVNYHDHGWPNKVWLNDGTGIFSDSQSLGNSYSAGLALGDLDGDGDLDAFVANSGHSPANKVWLNGEPAPPAPPVVPEASTLVLLGGAAASLSAYVALQYRSWRSRL